MMLLSEGTMVRMEADVKNAYYLKDMLGEEALKIALRWEKSGLVIKAHTFLRLWLDEKHIHDEDRSLIEGLLLVLSDLIAWQSLGLISEEVSIVKFISCSEDQKIEVIATSLLSNITLGDISLDEAVLAAVHTFGQRLHQSTYTLFLNQHHHFLTSSKHFTGIEISHKPLTRCVVAVFSNCFARMLPNCSADLMAVNRALTIIEHLLTQTANTANGDEIGMLLIGAILSQDDFHIDFLHRLLRLSSLLTTTPPQPQPIVHKVLQSGSILSKYFPCVPLRVLLADESWLQSLPLHPTSMDQLREALYARKVYTQEFISSLGLVSGEEEEDGYGFNGCLLLRVLTEAATMQAPPAFFALCRNLSQLIILLQPSLSVKAVKQVMTRLIVMAMKIIQPVGHIANIFAMLQDGDRPLSTREEIVGGLKLVYDQIQSIVSRTELEDCLLLSFKKELLSKLDNDTGSSTGLSAAVIQEAIGHLDQSLPLFKVVQGLQLLHSTLTLVITTTNNNRRHKKDSPSLTLTLSDILTWLHGTQGEHKEKLLLAWINELHHQLQLQSQADLHSLFFALGKQLMPGEDHSDCDWYMIVEAMLLEKTQQQECGSVVVWEFVLLIYQIKLLSAQQLTSLYGRYFDHNQDVDKSLPEMIMTAVNQAMLEMITKTVNEEEDQDYDGDQLTAAIDTHKLNQLQSAQPMPVSSSPFNLFSLLSPPQQPQSKLPAALTLTLSEQLDPIIARLVQQGYSPHGSLRSAYHAYCHSKDKASVSVSVSVALAYAIEHSRDSGFDHPFILPQRGLLKTFVGNEEDEAQEEAAEEIVVELPTGNKGLSSSFFSHTSPVKQSPQQPQQALSSPPAKAVTVVVQRENSDVSRSKMSTPVKTTTPNRDNDDDDDDEEEDEWNWPATTANEISKDSTHDYYDLASDLKGPGNDKVESRVLVLASDLSPLHHLAITIVTDNRLTHLISHQIGLSKKGEDEIGLEGGKIALEALREMISGIDVIDELLPIVTTIFQDHCQDQQQQLLVELASSLCPLSAAWLSGSNSSVSSSTAFMLLTIRLAHDTQSSLLSDTITTNQTILTTLLAYPDHCRLFLQSIYTESKSCQIVRIIKQLASRLVEHQTAGDDDGDELVLKSLLEDISTLRRLERLLAAYQAHVVEVISTAGVDWKAMIRSPYLISNRCQPTAAATAAVKDDDHDIVQAWYQLQQFLSCFALASQSLSQIGTVIAALSAALTKVLDMSSSSVMSALLWLLFIWQQLLLLDTTAGDGVAAIVSVMEVILPKLQQQPYMIAVLAALVTDCPLQAVAVLLQSQPQSQQQEEKMLRRLVMLQQQYIDSDHSKARAEAALLLAIISSHWTERAANNSNDRISNWLSLLTIITCELPPSLSSSSQQLIASIDDEIAFEQSCCQILLLSVEEDDDKVLALVIRILRLRRSLFPTSEAETEIEGFGSRLIATFITLSLAAADLSLSMDKVLHLAINLLQQLQRAQDESVLSLVAEQILTIVNQQLSESEPNIDRLAQLLSALYHRVIVTGAEMMVDWSSQVAQLSELMARCRLLPIISQLRQPQFSSSTGLSELSQQLMAALEAVEFGSEQQLMMLAIEGVRILLSPMPGSAKQQLVQAIHNRCLLTRFTASARPGGLFDASQQHQPLRLLFNDDYAVLNSLKQVASRLQHAAHLSSMTIIAAVAHALIKCTAWTMAIDHIIHDLPLLLAAHIIGSQEEEVDMLAVIKGMEAGRMIVAELWLAKLQEREGKQGKDLDTLRRVLRSWLVTDVPLSTPSSITNSAAELTLMLFTSTSPPSSNFVTNDCGLLIKLICQQQLQVQSRSQHWSEHVISTILLQQPVAMIMICAHLMDSGQPLLAAELLGYSRSLPRSMRSMTAALENMKRPCSAYVTEKDNSYHSSTCLMATVCQRLLAVIAAIQQ